MMLIVSRLHKDSVCSDTQTMYTLSILYKGFQKNKRMYVQMYVRCYVCTATICLLLCTSFIADEELYRWSVDLECPLLHCLIAIICTLPLQSFPYLILLSVELKGNPCIN
jgi:hypothetical protein